MLIIWHMHTHENTERDGRRKEGEEEGRDGGRKGGEEEGREGGRAHITTILFC